MSNETNSMVEAWEDRCVDWGTVCDVLENSARLNRDEYVAMGDIELLDDDGTLRLGCSGEVWDFSRGSLGQMMGPGFVGLGTRLFDLGADARESEMINQLYIHRWEQIRKGQEHKQMFLRLRGSGNNFECGSVRAFLTGGYKPIDHRWIADRFRGLRDDRLIRFDEGQFLRSGGDFVSLQLIDRESMPDGNGGAHDIQDSGGLGKMLAVSNSEVGYGRFRMLPSVYRSICSNGCIFGIEEERNGLGISMVHRGRLDLGKIAEEIKDKIIKVEVLQDAEIGKMELLSANVDDRFSFLDGVMGEQVVLEVGRKMLKNTKRDQRELLEAYQVEGGIGGAWSVVNAVTRFAQSSGTDSSDQQDCEIVAGRLVEAWSGENGAKDWKLTNRNAGSINVAKEIGSLAG